LVTKVTAKNKVIKLSLLYYFPVTKVITKSFLDSISVKTLVTRAISGSANLITLSNMFSLFCVTTENKVIRLVPRVSILVTKVATKSSLQSL